MRDRWLSGAIADTLGYVSERAVRLLLAAIVGIFVARYLGPQGYGLLSYAGGVFSILGPLTLLGMQHILVREFSTTTDWRPVLTSAIASQVPAALASSIAGFLIIIATRGTDAQVVLLSLVMLPVPVLELSGSARSYLEAVGRVRRIVVSGVIGGIVASLMKMAGVVLQAPVWLFAAAATVELAIVSGALVDGLPGRKRVDVLRRHFRRDIARRLRIEAWPMLLAAVAVTIYMRADILMLGLMVGDRETGLYAAAARLSEVWYFIPLSAAAAINPRLSRLFAAGESERYGVSTQRFMTAAVAVALLAIGFVLAGADSIIALLYGTEFHQASPVLRVHVLSAPFVFLAVTGNQWFIDRSMTRAVLVRSAVGAALNVVLNLVLIPAYGALGAAISTLISYASTVAINALAHDTRPLFWMQLRAFGLHWPKRVAEADAETHG